MPYRSHVHDRSYLNCCPNNPNPPTAAGDDDDEVVIASGSTSVVIMGLFCGCIIVCVFLGTLPVKILRNTFTRLPD